MTQYLPPNLLALFAARDPLLYLPPSDKLPHEKKRVPYFGVGVFLDGFEDPKDTPPPTRVETRDERKERKRKERQEQHAYKLEQDLALWDPASNPNATTDPFKSLFISRINFDTSEIKLRREFEVYGAIKKICMINDRNSSKPRGYAFIEYEHERDMHSAYKHADGKKIDGRRVLVDVERGRTVKGWRPRRLGGGLGGTRKGGPDENTRFSGRDEFGAGNTAAERGGFRGEDERPERPERPGGRRERSLSRGRDRRRRSRSKERPIRRSRSRDRRRSRSREKRRSRERGPGDLEGPEVPEDEDVKEIRKDRKRNRRSRSRDRERRRSRSRDRKRSKRSRSKERKFKIKNEFPGGMDGGYIPMPDGDDGGLNGNQGFADPDGFTDVRVKEEKADAYVGYGGPEGGVVIDPNDELEEGETEGQ